MAHERQDDGDQKHQQRHQSDVGKFHHRLKILNVLAKIVLNTTQLPSGFQHLPAKAVDRLIFFRRQNGLTLAGRFTLQVRDFLLGLLERLLQFFFLSQELVFRLAP